MESAPHTFTDIICGGDRTILWCPLDDYLYNPLNEVTVSGLQHPDWPLFWYDSRFGYENFMMGYHRFVNMAGTTSMWHNSGNTDTIGSPKVPGSAQDAIMADVVNS